MDNQSKVYLDEIARLRAAVISLTNNPADIYPTDAEADRLHKISQEDPDDVDKSDAAAAAATKAALLGQTVFTRTLLNAPGDVQAFAAAQGNRNFINPHARPTSAMATPALFPTMDPVAMGLTGAQKHEWDVLYPGVSYMYDALCLALNNITDSASLQTAVWLYNIYNLFTLRVDGLTLVVQKGAEIGNATMDAAIDPFADQLSNPLIKKAYLEVKSAAAKAALRQAASKGSSYSRNVETYKTGDFKGKTYSPPMHASGSSGGGGGASTSRPPFRGGPAAAGAAKST